MDRVVDGTQYRDGGWACQAYVNANGPGNTNYVASFWSIRESSLGAVFLRGNVSLI